MNGNWIFFEGFEKIFRGREEMDGGEWLDDWAAGAIWENGFEPRIHSPRWGAFAP